jgi:hypothetical protein
MGKIYKGRIEGDLMLRAGDDASAVTSVGGSVYAYKGAHLDLSACISVGRSVSAYEGAHLNLSACISVGGYPLPDPETAARRLADIARHALTPGALCMEDWHDETEGCGTAHCIAGWAVHLAGQAGYALELAVQQPAAGNILLGIEASKLFYLDDESAKAALHKALDDAGRLINAAPAALWEIPEKAAG